MQDYARKKNSLLLIINKKWKLFVHFIDINKLDHLNDPKNPSNLLFLLSLIIRYIREINRTKKHRAIHRVENFNNTEWTIKFKAINFPLQRKKKNPFLDSQDSNFPLLHTHTARILVNPNETIKSEITDRHPSN